MNRLAINIEIMEYMVWIVEITSLNFFNNDKTLAYSTLVESGIWDLYIENYDVTHTLSASSILEEIQAILLSKEMISF